MRSDSSLSKGSNQSNSWIKIVGHVIIIPPKLVFNVRGTLQNFLVLLWTLFIRKRYQAQMVTVKTVVVGPGGPIDRLWCAPSQIFYSKLILPSHVQQGSLTFLTLHTLESHWLPWLLTVNLLYRLYCLQIFQIWIASMAERWALIQVLDQKLLRCCC